MTDGRHLSETERPGRRLRRLVLPSLAAALVTGFVVAVLVGQDADGLPRTDAAVVRTPVATVTPTRVPYRMDRRRTFSRSAQRVTMRRMPKVEDRLFRTAPLNLWPAPHEHGKPLAVLPEGGRVAVTGTRRSGFAQIVYRGRLRWVHAAYLAHHMPAPPAPAPSTSPGSAAPSAPAAAAAGVTTAPCPDGSGTEAGLTPAAVTLFRSVCNAFPALTTYGGYDAHGEHSSGRAIDFMVGGDSSLGQAVADWARAHAAQLNLYDVIWAQHIWTPVRASEGWRAMPDRGSATANHYDHVHISVN